MNGNERRRLVESFTVMDFSSTRRLLATASRMFELVCAPDPLLVGAGGAAGVEQVAMNWRINNSASAQRELWDQLAGRAMESRCREVAALHLEIRIWQESTGQNRFTDIHDSQPDLSDIAGHYVKPGGNFWMATTGTGELAGFVGLQNERNGSGTVKRLAVDPRFQGRGVGYRLITELVDWAQRAGLCELCLATGADERAKGIYERHGFRTLEFDERRRDFVMRRTLRSPD